MKHKIRFFYVDDYGTTVDGDNLYIDSSGHITEMYCEYDGGAVIMDRYDLGWEYLGIDCG
jgi:hypothetical protein